MPEIEQENHPELGRYRCTACQNYFDEPRSAFSKVFVPERNIWERTLINACRFCDNTDIIPQLRVASATATDTTTILNGIPVHHVKVNEVQTRNYASKLSEEGTRQVIDIYIKVYYESDGDDEQMDDLLWKHIKNKKARREF